MFVKALAADSRRLSWVNLMGLKLQKFKHDLPETLVNDQDYYKFVRQKTHILNYIPEDVLKKLYHFVKNENVHWNEISWVAKDWLHEGELQREFYIYRTQV